jgi:hypothetical protein
MKIQEMSKSRREVGNAGVITCNPSFVPNVLAKGSDDSLIAEARNDLSHAVRPLTPGRVTIARPDIVERQPERKPSPSYTADSVG